MALYLESTASPASTADARMARVDFSSTAFTSSQRHGIAKAAISLSAIM
jgi:hypothetical protein